MKFAAVFAALLAVAAAAPTTSWTLNDLSNAIQNPATPASLLPYLQHALEEMMQALFSGQNMDSISIVTPGGVLPVEAVLAVAAAPPTDSWTLNDLSNAIQNPATPASLLPYLQNALEEMMQALFSGQNMDSISIVTPGGVLPVEAVSPGAVMPAEVDPTPVTVVPTPVTVAPTPVPAVINDAAGNPLVQIIVNINTQSQESEVAAPTPVPAPVVDAEMEPEAVYEPLPLPPVVTPEAVYEPQPLPEAVYEPQPLPEAPEAVVVVPGVPDSVAIIPVVPGTNPIDVIAVAGPDASPIDLLQPTPVAVAGAGQGILV